ncbi:APC family permease [Tepidibacter formicigenes]|jgi:APA family basic amino acid/polyamine antiporter|uniref:Serine/threonine exchange transporter, LAT family (TC 2.A.3.8.12) n=1 Tax=Tepidibacter formicigenes DSM 15518 TaxID=1123349 RepID=A0A1M6MFV4_9FIRM|nr:amino acid permease [Tepidibacter formicigenes]SHJ82352.1 serine/threonine exchange transporter, LAT family (TC 2.A.3.8.12) [Tepidibacter formicigenes DSM 15518]
MKENELKKDLGLVPALSIVVGMVIGSGVFFMPTKVFGETGAPGLGIIAWILGGTISIAAGLTAAEVSAAIPKTGGMMTYLKEIYGDVWGYLLGWAQVLIYIPAVMAALGIIFATQAVSLMGLSDKMIVPIGIIAIIFLTIMNGLGSKTGGMIQTVSTICKLIPLFAIIVVGFIKGDGGVVRLFPISVDTHPVVTGLGSALAATMFAYDGWICVGNIAGEMKNPAKDLPKAIIGGLSIIMSVYVLINIAYLFVLPAHVLASTNTPATDVANIIFGANGGKIITIGILVSIFGTLNGFILTGPRIPYAMAVENKLPGSKWIAKLHPKFNTPVNASILLSIFAIIYALSGNFGPLIDLIVFIIWIFYVMTFIGVFILRKNKPNIPRPYKVPMYPVIPILAIMGGLYIIVNTLITQPKNAVLGLIVTLIGLPIYIFRKNKFKSVL